MSTLKVAAINNPSASSGGLAISASGNVTGAGLDLITTQSFSAVSSVSINNCFSATYDNYRVLVQFTAGTLEMLKIRFRASGADNSANSYNYQYSDVSNTTYTGLRNTETSGPVGLFGTESWNAICVDIFQPAQALHTPYIARCYSSNGNARIRDVVGSHFVATAYDGMTLLPGSGSITGSVSIYGYRK